MSEKFNYNLNFFFTEQQQDSLYRLRKENLEYDSLRTSHAKDSHEMDTILQSLSEKDRKFAERFKDEIYEINGMEFDWIYLQGYKDCIRFLSCIGLWEARL